MRKFEIVKRTKEIRKSDSFKLRAGVALDCECPETLNNFDVLEDAKNELKKYQSEIKEFSSHGLSFYSVTEYTIEENEYDDDGEWVSGGDVYEFSEMTFFVVDDEDNIVGTFNNYSDAKNCFDICENPQKIEF